MGTLIVGAGGHGRVVLDIFRQAHGADPVGFLDGNPELTGTVVDGVPVIGAAVDRRLVDEHGVTGAVVAIGDNSTRHMYAQALRAAGVDLVNAIHPKSSIADTAKLGRNVVIAAGAVVCAHCRIGDSVIVNTASIVDHESYIGRAAHICPGARIAGRVRVEDFAFVGIGATVIQCLTLGRGSTVGAGTVVLTDVEPFTTVVGVPARCVKEPADNLPARAAAKMT